MPSQKAELKLKQIQPLPDHTYSVCLCCDANNLLKVTEKNTGIKNKEINEVATECACDHVFKSSLTSAVEQNKVKLHVCSQCIGCPFIPTSSIYTMMSRIDIITTLHFC